MKRWKIVITHWQMNADGSGTGTYVVNTTEGRFQPNEQDLGLTGMTVAKMLSMAQDLAWFSGDRVTVELQVVEDE